MKTKYILLLVTVVSFIFGSCNDLCKSEAKTIKKTATAESLKSSETSQKTLAMLKSDKRAFSCKLTSPELQKRKSTVIANLKGKVIEKIELKNGYSYKFKNTDETIDLLADFIKTERQCCDFFNFSMFVSRDQYVLMDITGEKGIKEFIEIELNL